MKTIIAVALLAAVSLQGASAFCVFNSCPGPITAYQLPIGGDSFKKVVQPGKSECCNFADCGPLSVEPGKCGKAQFCMNKGAQDTNAITASAILNQINTALIQTFSFIPGIGAAGAANDAAKEQLRRFGLSCDAVVSSFNGGIAVCQGNNQFSGAWSSADATPPAGTPGC